jgi:hypothetical protein
MIKVLVFLQFLFFLVSSPVSFAKSDQLPVELVYFNAVAEGDSIVLKWGTATEIENYGFFIERSFNDSTSWKEIDFVAGHGTSYSPKDYRYTDTTLNQNGTYYYRLKQVDTNGNFEYSWIAKVDYITDIEGANSNKNLTFHLHPNYPNPFNPVTNFSFSIPQASHVDLIIFNTNGQKVAQVIDKYLYPGNYTVNFNGDRLASGVYFYKISAGNFTKIRKMLLAK